MQALNHIKCYNYLKFSTPKRYAYNELNEMLSITSDNVASNLSDSFSIPFLAEYPQAYPETRNIYWECVAEISGRVSS